jgi:pyruvate/2-oxoglutarate dehydrogenase complex dihydrolipoamide acyltransferase (E2) component
VPWLSRNIPLAGPQELSPWRRVALSAWPTVSDASVLGVVELNAAPVLDYLGRECERTGARIDPLHVVAKALADTFRELPEINCVLRAGRLYRRRDVDIFFPVAMDRRGWDLSGVVVRDADNLSVVEISRELASASFRLRRAGDTGFSVKNRVLGRLLMRTAGFFLYTLNLWTPALGFPRNAFGSAAVTDLSHFGADFAFPPLLPIARLPLVVGVGAVAERYGADGKPEKFLRLGVVFDHRVIDGVYAGRICHRIRAIFANPEGHLSRSPK